MTQVTTRAGKPCWGCGAPCEGRTQAQARGGPEAADCRRSRPRPGPQAQLQAGSGPGAPGGLGCCGLYDPSCRGLWLPAFLKGTSPQGLMSGGSEYVTL